MESSIYTALMASSSSPSLIIDLSAGPSLLLLPSPATRRPQNDPKMAGHQLPLLVASLLFAAQLVAVLATARPYSAAAYGSTAHKKDAAAAAVQGVVYCQSCDKLGTWSLTGAKPLPSARVGVSCRDYKNRVRFYKSCQTDRNGYFYVPLLGLDFDGGSPAGQPPSACKVHLLSSADPKCNLFTNVNYGIAGAPLREDNKTASGAGKSYEVALYSAGPLAFRPAFCPLKPHY